MNCDFHKVTGNVNKEEDCSGSGKLQNKIGLRLNAVRGRNIDLLERVHFALCVCAHTTGVLISRPNEYVEVCLRFNFNFVRFRIVIFE